MPRAPEAYAHAATGKDLRKKRIDAIRRIIEDLQAKAAEIGR
jgi:L-asparaginase II